jgi:hypothetical protein
MSLKNVKRVSVSWKDNGRWMGLSERLLIVLAEKDIMCIVCVLCVMNIVPKSVRNYSVNLEVH